MQINILLLAAGSWLVADAGCELLLSCVLLAEVEFGGCCNCVELVESELMLEFEAEPGELCFFLFCLCLTEQPC